MKDRIFEWEISLAASDYSYAAHINKQDDDEDNDNFVNAFKAGAEWAIRLLEKRDKNRITVKEK